VLREYPPWSDVVHGLNILEENELKVEKPLMCH